MQSARARLSQWGSERASERVHWHRFQVCICARAAHPAIAESAFLHKTLTRIYFSCTRISHCVTARGVARRLITPVAYTHICNFPAATHSACSVGSWMKPERTHARGWMRDLCCECAPLIFACAIYPTRAQRPADLQWGRGNSTLPTYDTLDIHTTLEFKLLRVRLVYWSYYGRLTIYA